MMTKPSFDSSNTVPSIMASMKMKTIVFVFFLCISLFVQNGFAQKNDENDGKKAEVSTVKKDDSFFSPQVLKNQKKLEAEDNLNLLRHQPFYFAYGNPTSKVQLSFKYRIIKNEAVYFGYTQIMFWDFLKDSKPFKDSTYNPELFYTYNLKRKVFLDNIDFGLLEHNSNGKSGEASRSFNRSYVRFNFAREYKQFLGQFSIKLGYIYGLDKTNEDIRNYISPLEFKLSLVGLFKGWSIDRSSFDIRYFPGGNHVQNWNKGGYELSLSFRLGGLSILPAFYMQYFNGYAESLINYDKKVNEFRGGFVF